MFLPRVKNIFAFRTQILRPKDMFPSLATMKKCWLVCSAARSVKIVYWASWQQSKWLTTKKLKQITLKKKKKKKEEQEKGRERNWKDEEIEMLITVYEERRCLWDVSHKD